ncbi:regulator of protease activity HflC (stomatin/prohibitin superfamily) [Croceifilum oryzae]|uniref:Regulator of protease activity HflC (Stomatin/prohibitin superfamily) n=1 Tax=Croceifilum oryzae TaxID=1553429 RepID=A0AAJ1TJM3_9BACL|nr:SPFH domain-containing protein [Croceifilum oryzae]MDQ0417722.1 regulator of protease activity HflC (stomatin/prohibitin superfamily) [Croceifilum oryzae]
MERMKEQPVWHVNGFLAMTVQLLLLLVGGLVLGNSDGGAQVFGIILFVLGLMLSGGFVVIQPNESRVCTFLGKYIGELREEGFHFVNPFSQRTKISLRVRNFHTDRIKVNDSDGNPIEIAAVIVWRVKNPTQSTFHVDDYKKFADIQSETALRSLASHFPYDAPQDGLSLRGNPTEIMNTFEKELHERLEMAGIEVMEARISHLAYAPEIAQVMLRRQQASAVVAARQQIVEGAMGMVETVLAKLEKQGFELDDEKKAAMVNNLLVALVSEGNVSPVINTGTLYQ